MKYLTVCHTEYGWSNLFVFSVPFKQTVVALSFCLQAEFNAWRMTSYSNVYETNYVEQRLSREANGR
jgi:hypothetical protein